MDEETLFDKYSRLKNRDYEKDFNELIWPMRKQIVAALSRFTHGHGFGRRSRWMPSALTDRVDRLEALVGDVRHGHLPRPFASHSLRTQLRHNRKGVVTTVAVAAVLGAVAYSFVTYRRKKDYSDWE